MAFSCVRRHAGVLQASGKPRDLKPEPKQGHRDELRELSETFQLTVRRLASLVHELEAAHEETIRAEQEKKIFYREVIRAVTRGKLELVDPEDVPVLGKLVFELPTRDGAEYAAARRAIRQECDRVGMSPERSADLLLAAGEAITNAMKHATDGCCTLYCSEVAVIVRVSDRGQGIASHQLPATILTPGFSTKVSLGMGYTMMLKLCDRMWLATGLKGTIVQLSKDISEPPPEEETLLPSLSAL
jgi:anti-sigma regulatory factor (Ser/Thr protein kinase)